MRAKPRGRKSIDRLCTGVALLAVMVAPAKGRAAEYYVAPNGSDSGAGTLAAPFATLQKANGAAAAGDTIWLRSGTYYNTTQIVLSKSGTSDASRTKIWAYQNEVPVLDCSKYDSPDKLSDVPCVLVTGSWMHLRGLEIANGPVGDAKTHSISMLRTKNSSNNTFERLDIHHGFGPGLFIDEGAGGNLILNCDSHDNYDKKGSQGDGQNGDGFGVHYQKTGPSTIIRGCRAWLDSDDGYDLISQEVPVIVEHSFATQCGYINGGADHPPDGNGNGFKMGSSLMGVRHVVSNNVAWKNYASGFYANHSTGGSDWFNNTSYMNGRDQYYMLASSFDDKGKVTGDIILSGAKAHKMRNNIGFPNRNEAMDGVDSTFNTWDLDITQVAADFISTSDTGCTGPREADGSLPSACTFLTLKAGSPLIDKGTNAMQPFAGAAPDLGAYEYGATALTGSGGATAVAGSTSAGGSGGANGLADAGTSGTFESGGMPIEIGGSAGEVVYGAGTTSTAAGTPGVAGAVAIAGGSAGSSPSSSCSCRVAPGSARGDLGALLLAGIFGVLSLRRRPMHSNLLPPNAKSLRMG